MKRVLGNQSMLAAFKFVFYCWLLLIFQRRRGLSAFGWQREGGGKSVLKEGTLDLGRKVLAIKYLRWGYTSSLAGVQVPEGKLGAGLKR